MAFCFEISRSLAHYRFNKKFKVNWLTAGQGYTGQLNMLLFINKYKGHTPPLAAYRIKSF
ncbi:hypothetical protein HYN43_022985 [Mucilaginibacter celer]|uniref:Uncharacterized protein n=1 Tax=Mucilaginibacter celer TaxID=2305508 RepID=A0A494W355_9SPHI|nr:hypothetical protein HYN43_022985 [Mucilaginibacter celer]